MTNHDVKAIEYVLKERFKANEELHKVSSIPRNSGGRSKGGNDTTASWGIESTWIDAWKAWASRCTFLDVPKIRC